MVAMSRRRREGDGPKGEEGLGGPRHQGSSRCKRVDQSPVPNQQCPLPFDDDTLGWGRLRKRQRAGGGEGGGGGRGRRWWWSWDEGIRQ